MNRLMSSSRRLTRLGLVVAAAALGAAGGSGGCICEPLAPVTPVASFAGHACYGSEEARARGAPITVTATRDGADPLPRANVRADTSYQFTNVPIGVYVVTVDDGVDTRALPSFELTLAGGAPADDPACRALPPEPPRGRIVGDICDRHVGNGGINGVATASVDGEVVSGAVVDGHFELDVRAGTGNVVVDEDAPGVFNQTYNVDVPADGVFTLAIGDDCRLPSAETGCVVGEFCVDADTALAGATVVLAENGGSTLRTVTNVDGFFEFCGVVPGAALVTVGDGADAFVTNVTVVAGETRAVAPPPNCPREPVCLEFPYTPEEVFDGRVYFVVDRSGSMQFPVPGSDETKLAVLQHAIDRATSTLTRESISYGLAAFPDPRKSACEEPGATPDDGFISCVDACEAGSEVLAMGASRDALVAADNALGFFGGTPTTATLLGLKATLDALAADERPLAVVLATDGAPNCVDRRGLSGDTSVVVDCETVFPGSRCTSGEPDTACPPFSCSDPRAVAAISDIHASGVDVHVVGLEGDGDGDAVFRDTLNAMAVAGGAPNDGAVRYHSATDTSSLEAALTAVTQRIAACHIAPNFDVDGAGVDVHVAIDGVDVDADADNGFVVTGARAVELVGDACAAATTASVVTVSVCVD